MKMQIMGNNGIGKMTKLISTQKEFQELMNTWLKYKSVRRKDKQQGKRIKREIKSM